MGFLTLLGTFFSGNWKTILKYVLPLLLVAGGAFYLFEHGKSVQATADAAEIKKAKDDLAGYEKNFQDWKDNSAKTVATTADAQKKIVDGLQAKIDAQAAVQPTIKTIVKEVVKYVTAKQDATYPVSNGVVLLYNRAVQGQLGTNLAPLSLSPSVDVDSPSGLKLSTVAGVVAYNTSLCLQWRDEVGNWQSWYASNKQLYEHAFDGVKEPVAPAPASTSEKPSTSIDLPPVQQ